MGVCISCGKPRFILDIAGKHSLESPTYGCAVQEARTREATHKTELPLQQFRCKKMANTISNMKMTNPIKNLVSKRRKRYQQDGYNLDLTYIQDNLIAMGFPAEKLEGVYRNHIDDVVKFLESKHKDHYKIYNLCSERSYDINKFQSRVANYPFDDHNPPKIELIRPFCADVHKWLNQDKENVAAVHCKAGKGRTGVMICCYMLYSRQFPSAEDALNYYGQMRTHDRKGVTIPSQRRYVGYCASLVNSELEYYPSTIVMTEICLDPLPTALSSGQGCVQFAISDSNGKRYTSPVHEAKKGAKKMTLPVEEVVELVGDIKVEFFNKPKMKRKEKMFHLWFNTFFVREEMTERRACLNGNEEAPASETPAARPPQLKAGSRANSLTHTEETRTLLLTLNKPELDDAHKDKQNKLYSPEFQVSLYFHTVPVTATQGSVQATSRSKPQFQDTPSESSEAESLDSSTPEEEEEEDWESEEVLVARCKRTKVDQCADGRRPSRRYRTRREWRSNLSTSQQTTPEALRHLSSTTVPYYTSPDQRTC